MKIGDLQVICQMSLSTMNPERHWQWMEKLLMIAAEAKHICKVLHLYKMGHVAMQLEELIEDLETT